MGNKHYFLIFLVILFKGYFSLRFGSFNISIEISLLGLSHKLNKVLKTIFQSEGTLCYISNKSNNTVFPNYFTTPYVTVLVENSSLIKKTPIIVNLKQCNHFLILSSNFEEFKKTIKFLKTFESWNTRGHHVLVIEQTSRIVDIFKEFWSNDVIYTVIVQYDMIDLQIYHGSPFGVNQCGKNTYYSNVNSIDVNMFPVAKSLLGCEHIFAEANKGLQGWPYITVSNKSGIINIITCFLCKALKLKYIIKEIGWDLEQDIIQLKINFTEKKWNKFDSFLFASNRYSVFYDNFDVTDIFLSDENNWVVAKPNHFSNSETLFLIFGVDVWISIFFTYFSFITIWWSFGYLSNEKENLIKCTIAAFALNLSQSIYNLPKISGVRILIYFYMLYAFCLSSGFQGRLSSVLTNPGIQKGIMNVEEMAQSNIIPILHAHVKYFLSTIPNIMVNKIYNRSKIITPHFKNRLQHVLAGNMSTYFPMLYLKLQPDSYRKLKVLGSDFLLDIEHTYTLRKNHPFLDSFNRVIRIMHESGLQHKWVRSITPALNSPSRNRRVILSFEHIEGSFYILGVGYCVGFVVLTLEFIFKHFRTK